MANDIVRTDWSTNPPTAVDTLAGGANNGFYDPPAVSDMPAGLSPSLASEWNRTGGVGLRLAQAQGSARTILHAMVETDAFLAGFDGLPEAAQNAIFTELALGPAASVRSASDAEVSRFASTEEGDRLVKEWRGRSSRNIGKVHMRLERILKSMSPADREAALDWYDGLDTDEAYAVLKELGR